MAGLLIAAMIVAVWGFWLVRQLLPVKDLAYVDAAVLRETPEMTAHAKIVDVRDPFLYEKCHISGAINISLGRLPFLWNKELSPDEPVVILSESVYQSKKAARLLKNRGFRKIYAVRGRFCA
ncbi:rhodanese-like domain-containing protein [Paenibacillus sp. DYY-L-2]|uniref:rhodanese-like domain-containing protein n=1 Tax=Paenibacillus sp. DYY-L-2 TaxID=3447013 RepID=UPI003F4F8C9F